MARIKTTGAELKKFWGDDNPQFWPEDSCVDGMWWQVNGAEQEDVDIDTIKDDDQLVVEGVLMHGSNDNDFAALMRKWRKTQTSTTVVVELPVEHQAALAEFLKGLKGKIVK
jgi:hypothetical protein